MKNRNYMKGLVTLFFFIVACFFMEGTSVAEEKGFLVRMWEKYLESRQQKTEKAAEKETDADSREETVIVTKKSVIKKITALAREYPEILKSVPGFSYKKGWDGKMDYYYAPPGDVAFKLQECDKDTLVGLLGLVNQEVSILKDKKKTAPSSGELMQDKKKTEPDRKTPAPSRPERKERQKEEGEKKEGKPEIPFTNEEMIDILKKRLNTFSEIVYIIPDLYVEESPEGEKVYYYETPETGRMELEELDKDTLHGLFSRANNEATRINSQRIMRQIQQQEQIIRSIQMPPQQPVNPPQPPKIYVPPQPPKPPAPPPRQPTPPPRQPTPPPKPPTT